MKVYIVAITSGSYMIAEDNNKVYKRKSAAIKRCEELNRDSKNKHYKVLVADNWHEEIKSKVGVGA